jgi:hypothetical protein
VNGTIFPPPHGDISYEVVWPEWPIRKKIVCFRNEVVRNDYEFSPLEPIYTFPIFLDKYCSGRKELVVKTKEKTSGVEGEKKNYFTPLSPYKGPR